MFCSPLQEDDEKIYFEVNEPSVLSPTPPLFGSRIHAAAALQEAVTAVARQLGARARAAYGPCGQLTCSFTEGVLNRAATSTSCAANLIGLLRTDHGSEAPPLHRMISRLLLDASAAHVKGTGDGGLFVLVVATALLDPPEALSTVMLRVWLPLLTDWAVQYWQCGCGGLVERGAMQPLLGVARSCLHKPGMLLHGAAVERLAVATVEATLRSIPAKTNSERGNRPYVRVLGLLGDASTSQCEQGLLIDATHTTLVPLSCTSTPVLVAVFGAPLSPPDGMNAAQTTLWAECVADMLCGLCVRVVGCQQVIHPLLVQQLAQRQISSLPRLSRLHGGHPLCPLCTLFELVRLLSLSFFFFYYICSFCSLAASPLHNDHQSV